MANETMSTENTITTINQVLTQHTDRNGVARQHALQSTVTLGNLIPPTVSFESHGRILVAGAATAVFRFAQKLPLSLHTNTVLLCTEGISSGAVTPPEFSVFYAKDIAIDGFLGAFDVQIGERLAADGKLEKGSLGHDAQNLAVITTGQPHFDVVVDLTEQGIHQAELPPLGYYAVGRGVCSEEETIEALPDLTGTFDKPKFFRLDTEKCAHTSRGLEGCTRCIDACPADALDIVKSAITINPYLCQGMGSCATACPTEAISYALPDPDNTQHFLHQLLTHYHAKEGVAPIVLFYADDDMAPAGETLLANAIAQMPSRVIPVRLEELASVGIDTWFSALVYGATQVVLAESPQLHAKTRRVLVQELDIAARFLKALGLETHRIAMLPIAELGYATLFDSDVMSSDTSSDNAPRAKLEGSKREKLSSALDLLAAHTGILPPIVAVPENAPYGRIDIDTSGCTLCMGCVTVCPTDALKSIGTTPGMTFREQDCVQCGLCEQSCPESVISLTPRYNWDSVSRQQRQTLHQEEAAECISCGKPFAPVSMVNMLIERLRNHSHFQDDAIKRLSMCEDCRVRDMVADMIENPDQQIKA